jgi:hypothetical protein
MNSQGQAKHIPTAASLRNQRGYFSNQKSQMSPNFQNLKLQNKSKELEVLNITTIICKYGNKGGHFERDCRKEHYDLAGKRKTLKLIVHLYNLKIVT